MEKITFFILLNKKTGEEHDRFWTRAEAEMVRNCMLRPWEMRIVEKSKSI